MEFVSYFYDRNIRLTDFKTQLNSFIEKKKKLHDEQTVVQKRYDQVIIYFKQRKVCNNKIYLDYIMFCRCQKTMKF